MSSCQQRMTPEQIYAWIVYIMTLRDATRTTKNAMIVLPHCSNPRAKADALYARALVAVDQFTYDTEVSE